MSKISLGRYVYGLAAIISGVFTFAWRDLNAWREITRSTEFLIPRFFCTQPLIELLGGLAILWAATRRIGAIFLGVIYLIFALLSGSFPFVHTEWCQMRNQVYQPASQHSQPCT